MADSHNVTVTPKNWQPTSQILESGIAEIRIRATPEHLPPLVATLSQQRPQVLALLNLKRAQLTAIPNMELGAPLIAVEVEAQLPSGLLDNDSLHLAPWTETNDTAQMEKLSEMLTSDAAILIFTNWDREQFVEQRKLYWGWMLRPSTLQFQFRQGTKQLTDQMVGPDLEFLTWDSAAKHFLLHTAALHAPARLALFNEFV